MSPESACPDEHMLQEFAAGTLGALAEDAVRAHLVGCRDCREALAALQNERTPVSLETGDDCHRRTETGDSPTVSYDKSIKSDTLAELPLLQPSADPKAVGKIDSYEVLRVLGRGGMGIVLDAFDTMLHRRVAIKVLSPQLATSRKAQRRFLREARASAGINHPNVVTIHAVAEQAGMPYLVMEFVPGRTLRERIRLGSPLDLTTVLRIAAQIAAGLAAAHEHGVIHRDIKPANILLEDGIERVKITDFGLALVALDASQLSSADRPVGTPAYMSPEQVSGTRVDARSDLFSLGCVMYAMVTGKSPFVGNNTLVVARMVADHEPPPLHEVNADTPHFLSDIVRRLLAKDPRQRYQSAEEVRDELLKHLADANQNASDLLNHTIFRSRPARKQRRWIMPAAGAILATCLAAAAYFWPRHPPEEQPPLQPGSTLSTRVLSVSKAGDADFSSIQMALAKAEPGATIRVLDEGEYEGALSFHEPERLRDITLEAPHGATVTAAGSGPVVTIKSTAGLTCRGLQIRAHEGQHCVSVIGVCEGLTFDGVSLTQPPDTGPGGLVLWQGAHGSSARPILLRNVRVQCGEIGIVLLGTAKRPSAWVHIEGCRFTGPGVQIAMQTAIQNVRIEGNIFANGLAGVSLDDAGSHQVQRLSVRNNTFYGMTSWLALGTCSVEQDDVAICQNLILASDQIKLTDQDLTAVATKWFRNNWWERSPGINENQATLAAELKDEVKLLSREPADADFLQPTAEAMPMMQAAEGSERAYIGAMPPAPASSGKPMN